MEQKIWPMSDEDAARIEMQRAWVRDHFEPEAQQQYNTVEGKLMIINTIIDAGWVGSTETWKLQSLGIALGDALAQAMELIWVTVEDELGRDPALQLPSTTIVVFPLTAISKRIERGDKVDARELFDGFRRTVERMRLEGY
jgi:hypothetical protein